MYACACVCNITVSDTHGSGRWLAGLGRIDFLRPHRSTAAIERVVTAVRSKVPFIERDVFMTPYIEVRFTHATSAAVCTPLPHLSLVLCACLPMGRAVESTYRRVWFCRCDQAVWSLIREGAILKAVDLTAVPSLRFPASLLSASSILRSSSIPLTTAVDDGDVDVGLPGNCDHRRVCACWRPHRRLAQRLSIFTVTFSCFCSTRLLFPCRTVRCHVNLSFCVPCVFVGLDCLPVRLWSCPPPALLSAVVSQTRCCRLRPRVPVPVPRSGRWPRRCCSRRHQTCRRLFSPRWVGPLPTSPSACPSTRCRPPPDPGTPASLTLPSAR